MSALASLSLALLAAIPQNPDAGGPDAPMATYRLLGADATVSRTDVALEMAFHLRRRDRGKQACEQLVDTMLTRTAAVAKGVMPDRPAIETFWNELQRQLQAAGRRPQEFPWIRNSSEAELFDLLAVQLAQERLVRAEVGLGADEPVGGEMLKLWLQEERKRVPAVTDPDALPHGAAARVGDREIPLFELGMLLLRTADDEERDRFVRQVVYLNTIEELCRREGIAVTPSDLDAAIQRRADEAARDSRYRGITFENLLKAEGLTPQSLREQRVFRAQILLDKLTATRFPDQVLGAELEQTRQQVLDLVGPRRRLGMIFLNALAEPNGIVTRDFDRASKELETARQRLEQDTFETVARITSEHASSKMKGGEIGWHRRRSEQLPDAVLAAAFALGVEQVSAPIRAAEGCFLVKVLEVEPVPTDALLLQRLRKRRGDELGERLLREAEVKVAKAAAGITK
jgi:parvulin-like peptidyl-prolyl isomerase